MNGRLLGLAGLLAAGLAGCVSQGTYPSLAPRPAEREDWTEEPVHAAPVVADDAALGARIAALRAQAREGGRAFDADLPATERATAHPGAEGSDSWIEAQQAISRLEASRARTTDAVTELHQLRLARGGAPTSAADLAALDAAIGEADAMAERQQRQLDRVNRR
ncbi:MAG: hypothetical protein QOC98_3400 [Frankiaceae bacterium]|jgi:hypothetical protein|nr:hypothetical protein [Frankiaceae bacterium]